MTAKTPIAHKQLCAPTDPQRRNPPSATRMAVEALLRESTDGITPDEMAERSGIDRQVVHNAMIKIREAAANGKRGYNLVSEPIGRKRKYRILPEEAPAPKAKPIQPKPEGATPHALVKPDFNDSISYPWPHLQPHYGRPDADAHKLCGSRRGNTVEPYSGAKPMCVGAAGPVAQGGGPRGRFAA